MDVFACFDVEDIVHPDADDIPLDLARLLADDGIVASMYVVGEKARTWERRGRTDVIAAVGQHDVGLHTDHHSIHPTVSEYLEDKGWADGVAEAMRQEGPGVLDLARLFGRFPSSWATGGSSWGPQIPAATHLLGLPAQVYAHVHAGETGACWFAGQLCYPDALYFPGGEDAYADDATFEAALPALLEQVNEAQRRSRVCLGQFVGHPTRLRYKQFWDSINYAGGHNADPSEYRFAPRRTDAEYQTSLRNVRRLLMAINDLPGVQVVSTSSITQRFAGENRPVAWGEVRELAHKVLDSAAIQAEDPLASPAQTLDLLARAAVRLAAGDAPAYLPLRTVLGPTTTPPNLERTSPCKLETVVDACRTLAEQIGQTGHLPAAYDVEGLALGPGALLRGLAAVVVALARGEQPTQISFTPGPEDPAGAAELVEEGIYQMLPNWPRTSPICGWINWRCTRGYSVGV